MRLNEDSYRKKVRAGWLGKCIGGNLGAIPECLKKRSYFLKPEDFMPEKMLANDDLDLQLVWLQVLLDKGLSFTSDDLMEEFIKMLSRQSQRIRIRKAELQKRNKASGQRHFRK